MKNIIKKFFSAVAMGIIPLCVLLLIYKFVFATEDWFWGSFSFVAGWSLGYFIALVLGDKKCICTLSRRVKISLSFSVILMCFPILMSLILDQYHVYSYMYRMAFAFIMSVFIHLFVIRDEYSGRDNEAEDEELGFEADDIENINDIF